MLPGENLRLILVIMKYELKIPNSQGQQLEVLQELPDKGDQFPTVILVPGFGVDLHEYGYFDEITTLLLQNGFQTFRFSFSGTGKSQGNFEDMTIESQATEFKLIVDYVLRDRFTMPGHVGIFAQSFGASVVISALPITGISTFMFSGTQAFPGETLARHFKRQRGFNPEAVSKMERSDKTITRIDPQFWRSEKRHNLVGKIRQITEPVLFIHGSKDKKVKGAEALLLYNAVTSKKKFHLVENSNHSFTGRFRPKVLELIVEWFEETLR
ncbi:TPA: hypothetical protein DIV55_03860 [Patescibacteria group bacterium]|uniref:Alpha/beta fold family hydrolase n=1 Tax=Candidatus Gottesmanbacteria bacterium GW2011_GWA1_43_11 TaxID=1618436 RepID=A0A0G1CJ23_9BACT|nr:MAG: Alpha/beta fold family hydrolase [Candidatus Gottesmanbacteria bacterium GW2011_GWA1_43_11]HCS78855.1 hypothetical protein [Patescibacteria group bacterium]